MGGGAVARRKVLALVDAGFAVTVVAPEIETAISESSVTARRREFAPTDLEGFAVVFACTNDRLVNRDIGERCRSAGTPVLVADAPGESTFYSLATARRGSVRFGVSTDGSGPGLAASIRDILENALPPEVADQADQLRRTRRHS